jgi:hypothetical protein
MHLLQEIRGRVYLLHKDVQRLRKEKNRCGGNATPETIHAQVLLPLLILIISVMILTVVLSIETSLGATGQGSNLIKDNSQNTSQFVSYQDKTLGIQFQYPVSWKKAVHYSANTSRIDFFAPLSSQSEIFPPSLVIAISNSTQNSTLAEITKAILAKAKQSMLEFDLLQSNVTELAGIPAQKLVYTFRSLEPSVDVYFQTMNILMVKGNKLYTISYTESTSQYGDHLPAIESIIGSFATLSKIAN